MANPVAVEAGGVSFPAGDERMVKAEAVESLKQPYNLEKKWTFWFDDQSKQEGAAWEPSLREVYTFDTVE
ncbi:hypothetical protein V2J09_013450 [Rumex salicifolius]